MVSRESYHGEAVCSHKLTERDVRVIRQRLAKGEHCRALAAEFGVTFQAISDIGRRRTWRHVQ